MIWTLDLSDLIRMNTFVILFFWITKTILNSSQCHKIKCARGGAPCDHENAQVLVSFQKSWLLTSFRSSIELIFGWMLEKKFVFILYEFQCICMNIYGVIHLYIRFVKIGNTTSCDARISRFFHRQITRIAVAWFFKICNENIAFVSNCYCAKYQVWRLNYKGTVDRCNDPPR